MATASTQQFAVEGQATARHESELRGLATSMIVEIADDEATNFTGEFLVDDYNEEDCNMGSSTSSGDESDTSASTAGQSVVTFAQVVSRQEYDRTETADAVMQYSDTEEVAMRLPNISSLTKLESKYKRAPMQSSLQRALESGPPKTEANVDPTAVARRPMQPPARDEFGKLLFESEKQEMEDMDMDAAEEAAPPPQSRYAVRILRKRMLKMKEENERLNECVRNLNAAVADLRQNCITAKLQVQQNVAPAVERIDSVAHEQVSTEMVEWSPSRHQRRSKKTPLQLACRTPPRPPPGTPQIKKKSRISNSPSTNRYEALDHSDSDDEMAEAADATLAEVEERVDALKIRNTHVESVSIKKNGADGPK
jgi:hypothetical protein